ncbi:nicotinate-nucleotide adenylyltransferase [Shewanella sp. NIFS-20-20]|uniref:nicotinate-nucleotide adenylyltransferase n=1 Tax=Shewanella sp. NIFS-20-20 TaxID=2853806 RepID=UPI00210B5E92|nr:nicotinate-nucleotide adenylyltransferase [Shewanella sp. NIFS-20-20]
MVRIALLGGTFDPIHLGHIHLALAAKQQLAVDEVWLLPNATPPHKPQPKASNQHRLAMLSLACEQWPALQVCDIELKQTGPNYTHQTLQALHGAYPQHQWVFLMGMDSLVNLPSWKAWDKLLELTHIGVCQRPGWALTPSADIYDYYHHHLVTQAQLWHTPQGKFTPCEMPAMAVSSSDIRQQIASQRSQEHQLPLTVQAYIEANQLYR